MVDLTEILQPFPEFMLMCEVATEEAVAAAMAFVSVALCASL